MRATVLSALCVLSLCFASPVDAQMNSSVGPLLAPIGGPVAVTLSNDSAEALPHGICTFQVFDAAGQPVFTPICVAMAVLMGPGEVYTTYWNQEDNFGRQVDPGVYSVRVSLYDGGSEEHLVQVGGTSSALTLLGTPALGVQRQLLLSAPDSPQLPYMVMASLSTGGGIPTCAGQFPLAIDGLTAISLAPSPFFQGFTGQLNASGLSTTPSLALPENPALAGIELHLAFVSFTFTDGACPFADVSAPLSLSLQ